MPDFVIVCDTPGIKQFVFGTDALAEIRGASALLDWLNREDSFQQLRDRLGDRVECVFANGGAAQFLVREAQREEVERALEVLAARYAEATGGEMRLVTGVAPWSQHEADGYPRAVQAAVDALYRQRDMALGQAAVLTWPLVEECQSTSHLPALGMVTWGDERLMLSESSQRKREAAKLARRGQLWREWLETIAPDGRLLPLGDRLRVASLEDLGDFAERRGYIGLVYADGNAMGRLVQELDHPEVYRDFSELVDGSLRQACYQALTEMCRSEIAALEQDLAEGKKLTLLPAEILLLGGDDLLVALPADRALPFARRVAQLFEQATHRGIQAGGRALRAFFEASHRGLAGRGLTISCGVAIGPGRYPFYLLLELAEELLKSAKRGGSRDPASTAYYAPAYVDFHVVRGAASSDLETIRSEEYQVGRPDQRPRTLRPYRLDRLGQLLESGRKLRAARLPRSKLHDLYEAALEPRPALAEFRAQTLWGRLREKPHGPRERSTLWQALGEVAPLEDFPWAKLDGQRATALADLVEVQDWLPAEAEASEEDAP